MEPQTGAPNRAEPIDRNDAANILVGRVRDRGLAIDTGIAHQRTYRPERVLDHVEHLGRREGVGDVCRYRNGIASCRANRLHDVPYRVVGCNVVHTDSPAHVAKMMTACGARAPEDAEYRGHSVP